MEADFSGKTVVITLNWNGKKDTLAFLGTTGQLPVIVVDNGSKDDSADAISKAFPSVTLLRNTENLGFTGGNNIGIQYAIEHGARGIVMVNNDTLINESTIPALEKVLFGDPKVGAVGSKIFFRKNGEMVLWYAGGIIDWNNVYASHRGVDEVDRGQYDAVSETDFITGCCFGVRTDVIEKVGMLDDKYYLYYEDSDWCQRIKRAGYKLLYVPQSTLFHVNASSSGGPGSPLHQYYQTRNRYLFGMRYARLRTKGALLRECFRQVTGGQGSVRQGAFDFLTGRFGKGTFRV